MAGDRRWGKRKHTRQHGRFHTQYLILGHLVSQRPPLVCDNISASTQDDDPFITYCGIETFRVLPHLETGKVSILYHPELLYSDNKVIHICCILLERRLWWGRFEDRSPPLRLQGPRLEIPDPGDSALFLCTTVSFTAGITATDQWRWGISSYP